MGAGTAPITITGLPKAGSREKLPSRGWVYNGLLWSGLVCVFLQKLEDKYCVSASSPQNFVLEGVFGWRQKELEHLNFDVDFVSRWVNALLVHFTGV